MNGLNGVNVQLHATRTDQGNVIAPMQCLEGVTVWDI